MKIDRVVTVTVPASDITDLSVSTFSQPTLLEVLARVVPEGSFDQLTVEWSNLGKRWEVTTTDRDETARYTIEYL